MLFDEINIKQNKNSKAEFRNQFSSGKCSNNETPTNISATFEVRGRISSDPDYVNNREEVKNIHLKKTYIGIFQRNEVRKE